MGKNRVFSLKNRGTMEKQQVKIAEIEDFLRKIWAFELLDRAHLQTLAQLVLVRQLQPQQILWLQGQKITHFTMVYQGRLNAIRGSAGGGEKLLSTLSTGYHFGLAEMITGAASAVTIIAAKESTILYIDYKAMKKQLLSNAEICFRLMQTMAKAIFSLTSELERASFESVNTRLARLLTKQRSSVTANISALPTVGQSITHEQLAIQIGASRETVSRALAEFRRKKLIKTAYKNITVINRKGLMQYIQDYDQ
jgi:CRP/FNR family transcriptional regulator, cyclic AMP receptor protein